MNKVVGGAVAVVAALCCLGGVVSVFSPDDDPKPPASCQSEPAPTAQASSSTDEAEPVCEFFEHAKVVAVIDGSTLSVKVDDDTGDVRILGIAAPSTEEGLIDDAECWARESLEFARDALEGEKVTLYSDPTQDEGSIYTELHMYVVYGDDLNFSLEAAAAGAARSDRNDGILNDGPPGMYSRIAKAESKAEKATAGLWGPPCNGETDAATPTPDDKPSSPDTSQPPAPTDSPSETPTPSPTPDDVYYANCSQARAAGAAPLYAGEPGYRLELDRDKDGIACELSIQTTDAIGASSARHQYIEPFSS